MDALHFTGPKVRLIDGVSAEFLSYRSTDSSGLSEDSLRFLKKSLDELDNELVKLDDSSLSIAQAVLLLKSETALLHVMEALMLASKLVRNVLRHPEQQKYYVIQADSAHLKDKIVKFTHGTKLMQAIGFELHKRSNGPANEQFYAFRALDVHSNTAEISLPPEEERFLIQRDQDITTELKAIEAGKAIFSSYFFLCLYFSVIAM